MEVTVRRGYLGAVGVGREGAAWLKVLSFAG